MSFISQTPSSSPSAAPNDHNVTQAGNDGISSLTWSPTSNYLVSTNWDGGVRCWEVQESQGQVMAMPKAQVNHEGNAPVLASAFSSDGSTVFTAGTDKAVRMWQLGQQPSTPNAVPQQIGIHDAPVRSVAFLDSSKLVVSGGWDKKLKFWDARQQNPVGTLDLPERCYDMDAKGNLLVIACANRQVEVYDVSGQPVKQSSNESQLKHQTRCVTCFPDLTGYAVGSIEGRVGIQCFPKPNTKDLTFAFKCHRQDSTAYPVNAVAFHHSGTFATAGGDGVVCFWDKDIKQRLKGFPSINKPITCANFNAAGNLFAYASSYDWSKGSSFYAPGTTNEIFIHYTTEDEINRSSRRTATRR